VGKGCWTKELLPAVTIDRPPPTFAMAQVLSGHGVFAAYLYRFKRRHSPTCACGEGEETPLHVFTQCRQFGENRPVAPPGLQKEESYGV